MKKILSVMAISALMAGMCTTMAYGASAKQTVSLATWEPVSTESNLASIGVAGSTDVDGYTTILTNDIHTANPSDLFIDVSLQSTLFTQTEAKSKGGTKDTAMADTGLWVKVIVDGVERDGVRMTVEAKPGPVIFNRRIQELSATFQGLLTDEDGESCLITTSTTVAQTDADGNIIGYETISETTIDEECLRPEAVELILTTTSANAFNFLVADVGSGNHTIEVMAKIASTTMLSTVDDEGNFIEGAGSANAWAIVGKGSMVVDEAKMVKAEDYEM